MTYTPEWARENAPTKTLSDADAAAYWKAHSVRGDCEFALREGTQTPADILDGWRRLRTAIRAKGKELPADRRVAAVLRDAWRNWSTGRAYVVPAIAAPVVRLAAKRRAPVACPHCGGALSAAA